MVGSWWRAAYGTERKQETGSAGQQILLSYLQLIETALAVTLRGLGISLADAAVIHKQLQEEFGEQAPFVSKRIHEALPTIVKASATRQHHGHVSQSTAAEWDVGRKMLRERLHQFDYEDGHVRRWYPRGREAVLVIDPQLAFGAPIIAGTAIPIQIIEERFAAGETEGEIAEDFGIDRQRVIAALALNSSQQHHVA